MKLKEELELMLSHSQSQHNIVDSERLVRAIEVIDNIVELKIYCLNNMNNGKLKHNEAICYSDINNKIEEILNEH